jgi:hypothetical protein
MLTAALLALGTSGAFSQKTADPQDGSDGVILASDAAAPQAMLAPDPPLAGTGVVHLGAEAFQAYSQATTWTRNSTLMLYATGPGSSVFDAPVMLPNGVTVKQVVIYYYDNEAGLDAAFYWVTLPINSPSGAATPTVFSIGASGNVRYGLMTNFPNPIDNGSNSYFVRASLPGGAAVALHSVRIDYSYTTALPAVSK